MGLQPTDAKPGPAFIKRFCGFHKPGEMPSGLYSGPFLDSQQTERPTTLTTFAALRFARMRLAARPSRSPSLYDRLRFGCATQLGRLGERSLSLPLRGVCWIRPPFSPQPTPVPDTSLIANGPRLVYQYRLRRAPYSTTYNSGVSLYGPEQRNLFPLHRFPALRHGRRTR